MPPPLGFGELYMNHFIPYHLELFLCPDGSGAWEGGGVWWGVLSLCYSYILTYVYQVHNQSQNFISHYEDMPIQMYRKFHLQKLKIFR